MSSDDLRKIRKYLKEAHDWVSKNSAASHKRRCAIRLGVREITTKMVDECPHDDWNHLSNWCNKCGVTKKEIHEQLNGLLSDLWGRNG